MSRFVAALHSGRILLMDGAMGTELQRAGIGEGECYEAWNLTHPEQVIGIHQAYVEAGAEVLLTNTFQANPLALARHGVQDRLETIVSAGVSLARSAAGLQRFILAAFGPTSGLSKDHLTRMIRATVGVDAVLLETLSDAQWLASLGPSDAWMPPGLPLLLSFTYSGLVEGRGQLRPAEAVELAGTLNAAGLGINCGRDVDMDFILKVLRDYREHTSMPLFARPNAGSPVRVGSGWTYPVEPAAMARGLANLLDVGLAMVGGCCGTTPRHIAVFRPMLEQWNATKTVSQ
jgi:5-methyltetrahydrofolate--homocysteine methyltransferase